MTLQTRIMPTKTDYRLWNAGYVKYIDHMGNDNTPIIAARMSTLNPTGIDQKKDDGLREFLWRHGHHSVFEQAILSVEIQVPIFIARQVLRHRTFSPNEHSQRYSEPIDEYYVPDEDDIKSQNDVDKQCSDGDVDKEAKHKFLVDAKDQKILQNAKYQKHNKEGKIAREMCRIFQPVSTYTRLYLTCDLRNWFNFLRLRLSPDAQKEIRDLAWAIYDIIKQVFPKCAELFEEYTVNSRSFGGTEMETIRGLMKFLLEQTDRASEIVDAFVPDYWSKRNRREFMEKLGL